MRASLLLRLLRVSGAVGAAAASASSEARGGDGGNEGGGEVGGAETSTFRLMLLLSSSAFEPHLRIANDEIGTFVVSLVINETREFCSARSYVVRRPEISGVE